MRKTLLLTSSAFVLLTSLAAAQSPSTTQTMAPQRSPAINGVAAPAPVPGTQAIKSAPAAPERISTDVPLTDAQRGKISQVLTSERSNPASVGGLPLKAGTAIPTAILLKNVPPEVGAVESSFRGKSYFVTPDAIVIVNAGNREIVSAFSFSGSEQALVPVRAGQTVVLSTSDREIIRNQLIANAADSGPSATTPPGASVAAGDVVPGSIALQEFPASVYGAVPEVKLYRYYQTGKNVVVVDPSQHRVVEVIQ